MKRLSLHFKIYKQAVLSACFAFAISCTPPASNLDQLTDNGFSCEPIPQAQVDQILGNFPNDSIKGQMQSVLPEVREIIAHMPDEHIQDLAEEANNGFYMAYQSLGGGTQGVTGVTFSSNGQGTRAACSETLINSNDQSALRFAFLHELGHCMQGLQENKFPGEFSWSQQDRTSDIYNEGRQRRGQLQAMNPPVRNYAFQSKQELFAESYDNYYCSPEANQYLDRTFPLMHDLMSEKFGAPRWETESSGTQQSTNNSIALDLKSSSTILNGKYTDYLEITVPSNIEQVKLCYGAKESCLQNQTSNVAIGLKNNGTNTKTFRTNNPITIQNNSAITLLGYDAANSSAVSISRGVKFEFE